MTHSLTRSLVALLIATGGLVPPSADARCRPSLPVPQLLTHAADSIPADGGVLIGWTLSSDGDGASFQGHDPAMNPDWVFTTRKRKAKATLEQLAPGLAVYRATAMRGNRVVAITLRGGKATIGKFQSSTTSVASTMPAPKPKALALTTTLRDFGRYQADATIATLTLEAAIPPDAAAVIVYRVAGTAQTPITWARVAPGPAGGTVVVYSSPGRCSYEPPGLAPPASGDNIAIAWVDAFGRRSPLSQTIVAK
jgi:hypothetical protein